jgi:plastocyanin
MERERIEQARERRQLVRSMAIGAAAILGLIGVMVGGFVFLTRGSADEPAASIVVSLGDNFFEPTTVNMKAGQTTKVALVNGGEATHNLWSSGPDNESGNGDDIRSADLAAGEIGSIEVKFDQPGDYGFSCTFHAGQNGRFVVSP